MSLAALIFLLSQLLPQSEDARRALFEREQRDPTWAPVAESAIREAMAELRGLPAGPAPAADAELTHAEAALRRDMDTAERAAADAKAAFLEGRSPLGPFLLARQQLRELELRSRDLRELRDGVRNARIEYQVECRSTICRLIVMGGDGGMVMRALHREPRVFDEMGGSGSDPATMWLGRARSRP